MLIIEGRVETVAGQATSAAHQSVMLKQRRGGLLVRRSRIHSIAQAKHSSNLVRILQFTSQRKRKPFKGQYQ